MCRLIRYGFFLAFLFSFCNAFAQPKDIVVDTVVAATLQDEKQDTTPFDLIGMQPPVAPRNLPKERIDSLKASDDFWYANAVPDKKEEPVQLQERKNNSLFDKKWFRDLLWVVILCSFTAVVLWYLYSSNILIFRKGTKKIEHQEEAEINTDDIYALRYDTEIAKAVAAKNYRLAIRLWYLQTLKELSEKGLIDYRSERTNSDYVSQLYNSPHYRDFFRLTRNFEYTWYGQFPLSEPAYEMMQTHFSDFKKGLR